MTPERSSFAHDRDVLRTLAVVWRLGVNAPRALPATCRHNDTRPSGRVFRFSKQGISAGLLLVALVACATMANAQVVRGTVRLRDSEATLDQARIIAEDRTGRRLGETVTGADGAYRLPLNRYNGLPFRVSVTRIGVRPTLSNEIVLAPQDTLETDLWVRALPNALTELRTTASAPASTLNASRLINATRRGWKVIPPDEIAERRATALGLPELLRSLGIPGLLVSQRPGECVKTTRTGQCLALIIDGVLVGGAVHINPRDIFFLAIVGQAEARAEWGDRAAYGALAVYTRMNGDPTRVPK
jgi:hypothetical protein